MTWIFVIGWFELLWINKYKNLILHSKKCHLRIYLDNRLPKNFF